MHKKRLNKKGFMYSIITSVLIVIILLVFSLHVDKRNMAYSRSKSIMDMNKELEGMIDDIGRATYIVGFRALLGMNEIIVQEGDFIDDSQKRFYDLFMNGKYKNETLAIMNGSDFSSFIYKMESIHKNLDIVAKNITIRQENPWYITIKLDYSLYFNSNLASWRINDSMERDVPIYELSDPFYVVYTNNLVPNQIVRSNVTEFYPDKINLTIMLENSYYIESNTSPNYIMRLEGNFNGDVNGIESFVNLDELASQGIGVYNRSVVDYIYFSGRITNNSRISDMPSWFRLDYDDGHIKRYGVENETIG